MTSRRIIWTSGKATAAAVIVTIWFIAAYIVGSEKMMTNDQFWLVPPIAITVAVPVFAFLAAYALSPGFRRFVLDQDMEFLTMLQHWRVVGFGFLLLHAHGVLPGLFAWPAGIGDIAIGLAAPLILMRLRRDPTFATSAGFVRYHYLGLLDFAIAVVAAGLTVGTFAPLTPGGLTSAAMDVWPLSLFPSFIVPIFIILHLTVLLKVRALRQQQVAGLTGVLNAA